MMKFSAGLSLCALVWGVASAASAEWAAECYPRQFNADSSESLERSLSEARAKLALRTEALENSSDLRETDYALYIRLSQELMFLGSRVETLEDSLLQHDADSLDCGGDPHRLWQ